MLTNIYFINIEKQNKNRETLFFFISFFLKNVIIQSQLQSNPYEVRSLFAAKKKENMNHF